MVADNIKSIIKSSGMKHKAIAERAGYSVGSFSNLLNGRKLITDVDILRIANALGVTPNDLYGITKKSKSER